MNAEKEAGPASIRPDGYALVWIDAEGARILRWRERVVESRVESEIPIHERSTYHVRHDPMVRRGGGGRGGDDAERHRIEHVRRFVDDVESALADDDTIDVLGTGELGERLASQLQDHDSTHRRERPISVDHCMPLTSRQIAARLKERIGLKPLRGGVGSYRWTGELPHQRSGRVVGPRRVAPKLPRLPAEGEESEA